MTTATRVVVNGEELTFDGPPSVRDVVARALGEDGAEPAGRGIAVAVNNDVIPRGAWASTPVRPGDRVEVLTATQGG